MQLSRFVVLYRDACPREHVLYDVVSDRYVGVDDQILAATERWKTAPPETPEEAEACTTLTDLGFLVRDHAEDEQRLKASFERSAQGIPETLYITWMPTLACNLACHYCFQKDHPATGRMSGETEAATLEWVLAQVDRTGLPRLVVHYIGGEPLTRKDLVLRTARSLSAAMASRAGTFEWELTTNGLGLEPGFVNDLLATGAGSVKVTLDGDRETHDKARVYRSGQGTFDAVFEALVSVAKACPGLKLRVGGNFQAGQESSYERLLERMEQAGLRGLLQEVRFKPIIDTDAADGSCAGCAHPAAEAETLVQIGRSVQKRGLGKAPLPHMDTAGLCELHWTNAFIVDPNGLVYKCLNVAGRPEMAVGSVREGIQRAAPLTAVKPWEKHAPCRTCAFLPVCAGGCLGSRYLQTGRMGEVLCRLENFERTFREEVVRRYLEEFHPDQEGAPRRAA